MDARKATMERMVKGLKEKIAKIVAFENKFFNDQKTSDFMIEAGGKTFYVSKYKLARSSPVFEKMFLSDFNESSDGLMKLDDDPEAVETFLRFIYMKEKAKGWELALKVIQLAHRYEIDLLKDQCELVLLENVGTNNVEETFDLAKKLELNLLRFKCLSIMLMDVTLDGRNDGPGLDEDDDEAVNFSITPNFVDFRNSKTSIHQILNKSARDLKYHFFSEGLTFAAHRNGQELGLRGSYDLTVYCRDDFVLTVTYGHGFCPSRFLTVRVVSNNIYIESRTILIKFPSF